MPKKKKGGGSSYTIFLVPLLLKTVIKTDLEEEMEINLHNIK